MVTFRPENIDLYTQAAFIQTNLQQAVIHISGNDHYKLVISIKGSYLQ